VKILILSCNTGEGHNSCAKALQEHFENNGIQCKIKDALSFISPQTSKFISSWHSRIYRRMPAAFDWGYARAEKSKELFAEDTLIYAWLTSGAGELNAYLAKEKFDHVLCTHVFAAILLSHTVAQYSLRLTTSSLATDYTCSPGFERAKVDAYFIPHENLIEEFVTAGVEKNKIVVSGIPIRQPFFDVIPKDKAKMELGMSPLSKHILIMCGSMGCGPLEDTVMLLSKNKIPATEISIVCGRNEKLQKRLLAGLQNDSKIHIYGYTRDIPLLMSSADLYVSKPGGLSTTEAATKKLPMMLLNVVGGCETYNLNFFRALGVAKEAHTAKDAAILCNTLISDETLLPQMEAAFGESFRRSSAELIYNTILQITENI